MSGIRKWTVILLVSLLCASCLGALSFIVDGKVQGGGFEQQQAIFDYLTEYAQKNGLMSGGMYPMIQGYPPAYAGESVIDGTYVLYLTNAVDQASNELRSLAKAQRIKVITVEHSMQELNDLMQEVSKKVKTQDFEVFSIRRDVETNKIIVYIIKMDEKAEKAFRNNVSNSPAVVTERVESGLCDDLAYYNNCRASLLFGEEDATCMTSVFGLEGTTSIQGTMSLYYTAPGKKQILRNQWKISAPKRVVNVQRTVPITQNGTYEVKLDFIVKTNDEEERITHSVSKEFYKSANRQ